MHPCAPLQNSYSENSAEIVAQSQNRVISWIFGISFNTRKLIRLSNGRSILRNFYSTRTRIRLQITMVREVMLKLQAIVISFFVRCLGMPCIAMACEIESNFTNSPFSNFSIFASLFKANLIILCESTILIAFSNWDSVFVVYGLSRGWCLLEQTLSVWKSYMYGFL